MVLFSLRGEVGNDLITLIEVMKFHAKEIGQENREPLFTEVHDICLIKKIIKHILIS